MLQIRYKPRYGASAAFLAMCVAGVFVLPVLAASFEKAHLFLAVLTLAFLGLCLAGSCEGWGFLGSGFFGVATASNSFYLKVDVL
ncbi:hypothetical protein EBZ39_10015 [bacterium]|nr:hypothetical protein [bacterium]